MLDKKVTRGNGLLEKYLSKKRIIMANKLIPNNKREGRILDIGCGNTPVFLMNTKFKEKYGLDKNFNKKIKRNIFFREYDIEKNNKLPFSDNYFDIVTML